MALTASKKSFSSRSDGTSHVPACAPGHHCTEPGPSLESPQHILPKFKRRMLLTAAKKELCCVNAYAVPTASFPHFLFKRR